MGMAGGVIVDFKGVPVRVGSGLSDSQRAFWYQDPDEIIGRTAEILYQNVTPAGSLRHPRLKGLRGDK
jgi:DNA ligase-1